LLRGLIAGRYHPLDTIATGARSTVFRAVDVQDQREVAIKRRSAEFAEHHRREVAALRRVRHPHVVLLLDAGEDESGLWLALELVEGETLSQRVARQPLSVSEWLQTMRQLLAALSAIHAAGLLHRDLNPDNILLEHHVELKIRLIDFELAQPPGDQPADAATGAVYCMAPEQFGRQPLDARTDLYALGVIGYFALTGRFPFDGDNNAQIITAHLHALAEPLTGVPAEIAQWILALLSRQPDARPAGAEAALAGLNSRMQRISRQG
jgi:eukaryotic-like serine/threonine-protein kinase